MCDWELIEWNPVLKRAWWGRDVPGGMESKVEYHVDDVLDANKAEANVAANGWKGDYHKVASLSPGIAFGESYIAQAIKEGDHGAIRKFLDDSENRHWRTKTGRLA